MLIPDRIRFVNKRFTNRVMMLIAGKKGSPIALIRHWGRKSGKLYEIPILVVQKDKQLFFALTYGKNVDWYRNILATEKAELRLNGLWIPLYHPRILEPESGRQTFGRIKGKILKSLNVNDFFVMEQRVKSEVK
jgi:deazaflavin-dependent oxidoreductase (nitroreductase family)